MRSRPPLTVPSPQNRQSSSVDVSTTSTNLWYMRRKLSRRYPGWWSLSLRRLTWYAPIHPLVQTRWRLSSSSLKLVRICPCSRHQNTLSPRLDVVRARIRATARSSLHVSPALAVTWNLSLSRLLMCWLALKSTLSLKKDTRGLGPSEDIRRRSSLSAR